MSLNEIVQTMKDAVNRQADQAKPGGYDTTATVRRIEGGTAWVHIPGGVDETPVKMTINAKEGDDVQVRVTGGRAFLVGNGSAPPTDDARANQAYTVATVAEGAAQNAIANANLAKEAADSAQASAATAETAAGEAVTAAGNAQTAAGNAQTSADNALVSLSTVEDVVGVLNWITAHGTMTTQSGGVFVPGQVYFVLDDATPGDYHVGNHYYSVVPEPKADDIDSYYVLTVDESVQNYVATHIVVDTEGLWIIPDSGGNKVLIATGAGSTYTTAGTYIVGKVGGVDTVLAEFGASGAQIGQDGEFHVITDANAIGFYEGADNLSKMKSDGLHFYNGNPTSVTDIVGGYDGSSKYGVITSGDAMIRLVDHDSNINNRYFEASVETDDSTYRYTGGSEVRGFDFVVSSDKYKLDGTTEDYIRLESGVETTSGKALELSRRVNGGSKSVLFSVDKSGNVEAAGDITDGSSNVLSNKQDKLTAADLTKPSVTKTSGNSTCTVRDYAGYGKVRMLTLSFKTTAAVSAGSNVFVGTLTTTSAQPIIATSGSGYIGSSAVIATIGSTGTITVRNIGAQIANAQEPYIYFTYIVS